MCGTVHVEYTVVLDLEQDAELTSPQRVSGSGIRHGQSYIIELMSSLILLKAIVNSIDMKHKALLIIYGEDGEIRLERELSMDTVIEILVGLQQYPGMEAGAGTVSKRDDDVDPPSTKKGKKAGGQKEKACCGSKGVRHLKTCPNNGRKMRDKLGGEDIRPEYKPEKRELEESEYDAIRSAMHGRNFSSQQYALVNKLPPKEVNMAVASTDYEDYIEKHFV